ncbi:MAG: YczE/YyaS/YitT family protein [Vibrio sp.]
MKDTQLAQYDWTTISKKVLLIIIGSIISAYGIDLAIHAGFGGATLAVPWQGMAKTFNITIGQASFIIAAMMIVFCWFYDRKQLHVGTILYQVVYSIFVDVFTGHLWYSDSMYVNFILMLLGIIIFTFGTALYSFANFGRGSYEALMFALVDKNQWKIKHVRMALDASLVVIGVMLGGTFGLCTVFTILMSGNLIQFFLGKFRRLESSATA